MAETELAERRGGGNDALRVFISYSRADISAAESVADALTRNGFDVKIDVRDLPYGEEWQAELAGFIAGSDTVVWLVSPDSVRSRWVNWELGEVVRLSKRLVPVRVRDVDPDTLPESLGRINLLPNRGSYDPGEHEQALVATLNTNRAWLRKATSLAEMATEWQAARRDRARLLRGRALKDAEAWAARPPRDVPAPASDTLGLILASRRAEQWRRRMAVGATAAVTLAGISLAWFGQLQAQNAREQERVALASSAQRRNEVARTLLESESQVGAAVGSLSASTPEEAQAIERVRGAWADRLTPIRDLLRSDGTKLWQVAGKQVISAGGGLATYDDGVVIAYAQLSPDQNLLFDSLGRILVLDGEANIVRSWRWKDGPGTEELGDALIKGAGIETRGLSRLKLFSAGPGVAIAVGSIEATYSGGEEGYGAYIDVTNGFGMQVPLSQREIDGPEASGGACGHSVTISSGTLAAIRQLYAARNVPAPFSVGDADGRAQLCIEAAYGPSGAIQAAAVGELGFIAPAGQVLTLPVLGPETSMWRETDKPSIERRRHGGPSRTIESVGGDFTTPFLPEQTFFERAMFRGTKQSSHARSAVEYHRYGNGFETLPPALRIYAHGEGFVVAGLFFDRWTLPEICWFGADWVVERCTDLGAIYDTGGGVFLTPSGDHAVVAGMEGLGSFSLAVVDMDRRTMRAPRQRTSKTVVEVFMRDDGQSLTAIDDLGVVWSYRFPDMELISTYDLRWPPSEEGPFRLGRQHLDFSSRGVVRRLDLETQVPVWIAAPFDLDTDIVAASISSDGALVMVTAANGQIRVLDAPTGMPLTSAFDPDTDCRSIEHDEDLELAEIDCDTGTLQRALRSSPSSEAVAPELVNFALDSPDAAERFFATVPAFSLGALASASPDIELPPVAGTVDEFIEANGRTASE
ncbi:MAG: toll/interleukin-1 receptor domain-containing protein [Rhizobiaceae bacterium]